MVKKKIDYSIVLLVVCTLIFGVVFVNRLLHGIETSDEAFYVVTGLRILKGNIPLGDMWEMNFGGAYVMLPFLFLRSLFVEGNDGIFIYLRICMLILNCIGMLGVFLYAKKSVGKKVAYLLGLVFVFYAPFQICNFSYNNMAILFSALSLLLIFYLNDSTKCTWMLMAGASMALAVLVYPTMIYVCVLYAVIILFRNKGKRKLTSLCIYILGGLVVAIPVSIHIFSNVGLKNVISNLNSIMSASTTPSLSVMRIFSCIVNAIIYFKTPFIYNGIVFSVYFGLMYVLAFFNRTKYISIWMVVFYPLVCCLSVISFDTVPVMNFIFSLTLVGPISIILHNDKKRISKSFWAEWWLSLTVFFVIAFSSGGGVENARDGLIISAIVSMKFVIDAIKSTNFVWDRSGIVVMLLLVISSELFLLYCGIYRDEPYHFLSEKVETGIYKGIYTTEGRKKHIEDLEKVLEQVEDKGETVLVLYHSCYAYMMLDMIPKTPSSWGCIDYEIYKYDNQNFFLDYLSKKDNVPENILVIDIPKEFDYGKQTVDRYEQYYPEINVFIEKYYVFEGEYQEGYSGTVKKYKLL